MKSVSRKVDLDSYNKINVANNLALLKEKNNNRHSELDLDKVSSLDLSDSNLRKLS